MPNSAPKPNFLLVASFIALALLSLCTLGVGLVQFSKGAPGAELIGFGVVALVVTLATGAFVLYAQQVFEAQAQQHTANQQMVKLLTDTSERMLISDAAKRIVHRQKDREALRLAIREDMEKHDYDAAMVLVSEMGRNYGYRLEAEQFREEIEAARAADLNQRINDAIKRLDQMLEERSWEAAMGEALKIQRLFPDSIRVKDLEFRVREARDEYKKDLQQRFLEAAGREDTELASELLREMDKVLTVEEAAPHLETARRVFEKKRQNMGLQFKMAIDDHDWPRAIKVGEQIIADFPNSKMAVEVRQLMPELKKKGPAQPAESAVEREGVS